MDIRHAVEAVGLAVDAAGVGVIVIAVGLAAEHWGRGYATEAAREALRFGFDDIGLNEIVSFTTLANVRSQRVMRKLGMTRDPTDDFDHPRVPAGPLRRHVLYRLSRVGWQAHRRVGR